MAEGGEKDGQTPALIPYVPKVTFFEFEDPDEEEDGQEEQGDNQFGELIAAAYPRNNNKKSDSNRMGDFRYPSFEVMPDSEDMSAFMVQGQQYGHADS